VRLPVGAVGASAVTAAAAVACSLKRLGMLSSRLDSRSGEASRDRFLDWRLWRRSESGRVLLRLSRRPMAILE
jgi:hypothetical protein